LLGNRHQGQSRQTDLREIHRRILPEQLGLGGFQLLPVDLDDVARVATLPFHHRDPFDRMLAAQALNDERTIVSADPVFRKYGVKRVW
jgi:PIN domain nuclease of toxin-antitoxin system